MGLFRQFLESREDWKELKRDYGIGKQQAMGIRKPPRPSNQDIEESRYLVIVAPSTAPSAILRYNHQLVARDTYYTMDTDNAITVMPLEGINAEGIFLRVPYEWLEIPTEEEIEHAEWLDNTFFARTTYVAPGSPKIIQYFNPADHNIDNIREVLRLANEALEQCQSQTCQRMALALEDDYLNIELWSIVADVLDEETDFDTTILRNIIRSNQEQ